jgi:hypothetical protein
MACVTSGIYLKSQWKFGDFPAIPFVPKPKLAAYQPAIDLPLPFLEASV